jgi:hypothetical protein
LDERTRTNFPLPDDRRSFAGKLTGLLAGMCVPSHRGFAGTLRASEPLFDGLLLNSRLQGRDYRLREDFGRGVKGILA